MADMTIPFVNLGLQYQQHREEILDAIDRVSQHGMYIQGEEVQAFEQGLARICGTRHAIGVGNGTDALALIMTGLGIGDGDEVITAPNSFIASAGAIVEAGARPVFADVGDDYCLDPAAVAQAITAKTRAIIAVHLTGHPARMAELSALAAAHNIELIEDAAQAIGASYQGRPVGSLGRAAGFSLHPLKNLHLMGDAGFVSTDDSALAEQIRRGQNHGLEGRDESLFWGRNSRLDAIQAAVGNVKLKYFDQISARFQAIGRYYLDSLQDHIYCPITDPGNVSVYHNFVVRSTERDQLAAALKQRGVDTKIHYPIPLHLMACSRTLGYSAGDFPEAERQAKEILSLPIYPELSDLQVEYITAAVKHAVKNL